MKVDYSSRWFGFGFAMFLLVLSFGLAAWSGNSENFGIFLWTGGCSFVFFALGVITIFGSVIADK